MPITANVIVRNEQDRLSILLPILKGQVDEIVLVDQESTDNTLEIAKKYCDKVLLDICTGYADTSRKLCMDNSTHEWILTVDADEFVTNRFAIDMHKFIQEYEDIDGFLIHVAEIRSDNISIDEIMEFGSHPDCKHNSLPCRYRLYRKSMVDIGGGLHGSVTMPHLALVRYIKYNAIVEVKNKKEARTDEIRYNAVKHGYFDKNIHF